MKSDLRNLATYEEQYAADQNGATSQDRDDGDATTGFHAFAERNDHSYDRCWPAAELERDGSALAVG